MNKYPKDLSNLIHYLKKLPGVGKKTAERFAFQIISWQEREQQRFSELLSRVHETIVPCSVCGCLMQQPPCAFCGDASRNPHTICIVASPKDVFAFEETRAYEGLYHVLGGLLSPIDGIGPEKLQIHRLSERVKNLPVQEMVLAFDSTIEGDATALYLKKIFQSDSMKISRLALGLPMGSSLDYIDESTLSRAFFGRQAF